MIPKFRAWDKRFSEFVKDFFVSEDGKIYKKTKDTGYGFAISRETSDKIILMQSTGLKDKNGKEIFEGDVIANGPDVMCMKRHNTLGFYVEKKGKVEFIADCAVLEEFEEDAKEIADSLEVIGNIWEDGDLIDGKKTSEN